MVILRDSLTTFLQQCIVCFGNIMSPVVDSEFFSPLYFSQCFLHDSMDVKPRPGMPVSTRITLQATKISSLHTGSWEDDFLFHSWDMLLSKRIWYMIYIYITFVGKGSPRWWRLKYFLCSPLLGEDSHFDEHIFQLGWFNHQPDPWISIISFKFILPLKKGVKLSASQVIMKILTTFEPGFSRLETAAGDDEWRLWPWLWELGGFGDLLFF